MGFFQKEECRILREIDVNDIVKAVSKLCIEANCVLNNDVYEAIERAKESE